MTRITIPALAWIADYKRTWLRGDLIAGVTLAAYLLPASIGDASLAGLPPQAGIYSCVCAGLVFWIFCGSRQTAPTVTSAISMLIGASIPTMAGDDPSRFAALASTTALMVGLFGVLAYVLRLGTLVNFFSEIVLVGFKAGLALYLAGTQLPKLFGFAGSHGDFWANMSHFVSRIGDTHLPSLALGATALAVLLVGKRVIPHRPVALIVLVGSIALAAALGLDRHGVALLGHVPRGVPLPRVPDVSRADVSALLPLALAGFLLAAVETSAIGRMFAAKRGYRLDATQEFLAIGAANLSAGLGGGFAVGGGSSQSLVNEAAGAQTPLSGLVAALITLCVALFLTGLLRSLPQPVLAAIVLAAITGLFDVAKLREIWRFSREDFAVSTAAFAGVLAAGVLDGV